MYYKSEFSTQDFKFWSDAADTASEIIKAGKCDEVDELMSEIFCDDIPTDTQINDIFWFERDMILAHIGILEDEEND